VVENGTIVIEAGRIRAIGPAATTQTPAGATTVDAAGLTIVPGFWNSHVHFNRTDWANAHQQSQAQLRLLLERMLTRHGFTTVVDTGSSLSNTVALRKRIDSGDVAGPSILTAGPLVFPKGVGLTPETAKKLGVMPDAGVEAGTAAEARTFARQILDDGADAVKMYAATWFEPRIFMAQEVASALATEAHARGKLAFAHPTNAGGIEIALKAGADVLVHVTPEDGVWSDALVARLVNAKVSVIPTLMLWRIEAERFGGNLEGARRFQQLAVNQLAAFARAKGDVLFGTDVGYIEDDNPREEFEQMAAAGMSTRAILAALTTRPAARFGRSTRSGHIAPGADADLVLLGSDPIASVRALSDVRTVVRNGRAIYGTLPPSSRSPAPQIRQ